MTLLQNGIFYIAALLACHNRREKTMRCLHALSRQIPLGYETGHTVPPQIQLNPITSRFKISVFLVDDGSSDGTADEVRTVWPDATILQGGGKLYWCGGMRVAWAAACRTDPDYYLLLNDDTMIEPSALSELLSIVGPPESRILATGAIVDPATQKQIYGGHRKRGRELVMATGQPERCETMNANCALVPRAVFREIGMFHKAYTHSMGDFDYGFEANRRGIPVFQTGRVIGQCHENLESGSWRDTHLSRRQRWKILQSPKGLPWREWLTYTRRNEGILWPIRFCSPILRILLGR